MSRFELIHFIRGSVRETLGLVEEEYGRKSYLLLRKCIQIFGNYQQNICHLSNIWMLCITYTFTNTFV